jgi:hypothetical protein
MSKNKSKIEKLAPVKVEASKPEVKTSKIVLEKGTDKTTLKNAEQSITYTRSLKWIYPADCTSAKDRKVFRQKNRGTIRRAEAHALKVEGKEREELIAKANEVRKVALAKVDDLV